ncbi:hypothetical protein DPMN_113348 [Dreissena polymorpha]|uniref:Uncharacterized protein n=1 Tax=Dreissena polymorpha TaxID=45954 RepID=A0A9D4QQW8_DREPO|nr:hypothetical protein DPMN_113348 [Dreissena polymorpha]
MWRLGEEMRRPVGEYVTSGCRCKKNGVCFEVSDVLNLIAAKDMFTCLAASSRQPYVRTCPCDLSGENILILNQRLSAPGEVYVGVRAGYRKRPTSRGLPGSLKCPV